MSTPSTTRRMLLTLLGAVILGGWSASIAVRRWLQPWDLAPRGGVVMIDDRLSQEWAPSARLCTNDWFGDFSTYGLSAIAELLGRRGDVVVNRSQEYTSSLLGGVGLLVFKVPQLDLTDTEMRAVTCFVEKGGRLLLIGDHTDLFGSSARLNRLAGLAGMAFRNDAVSNADGGGFTWVASSIMDGEWTSLGDGFEMMTGCSIAVDRDATVLMSAPLQACVNGDYGSLSSNFGGKESDCSRQVGRVVSCAAGRYGQGQICLFADSTIWSTFALSMFERGRVFQRLVAWNLENRVWGEHKNWLSLAAVLAGLSLATWLTRGGWAQRSILGLSAIAIGAASAVLLHVGRPLGRNEVSAEPDIAVVFGVGGGFFPEALGGLPTGARTEYAFDTLLTGFWRQGVSSCVVPVSALGGSELSRLGAGCGCLCVLSPRMDVQNITARAREFVASGRDLIVGVRGDEVARAERDFAEGWGFRSRVDSAGRLAWDGGELIATVDSRCGARILRGAEGAGNIVLLWGCDQFSRSKLGHCMDFPSSEQVRAYDVLAKIAACLKWPDLEQRRKRLRVS